MGSIPILASLIDWGWLRIGPPYIYININPVIVTIGPLALRWYGLMYAVAIILALFAIRGYVARKGITQNMVYRIVWWCVVAGLIGGRLYFVVQQDNFVSYYLAHPEHILATWEGGMAFFGAIFLVIPTLFWRAKVERINPLVLIDAGVLFAAVGQIFGRIGNLINGDIIGYQSNLPWSTVYVNPNSWACGVYNLCGVPVQPAAAYELLTNIVLLAVLFYLARRVTRPGVLMMVYLFGYVITQFLIFFVRDNEIVSFLGMNPGLKQAQWTSLVVFILLIPLTFLVFRWHYSRPIPAGEDAATYGIPQKPTEQLETHVIKEDEEEVVIPDGAEDETPEAETATEVNEPANVEVEHSANGHTPEATGETVVPSEQEHVS